MEPGRHIAIDRFGGPTARLAGLLFRVGPLGGRVGDRSRLSHLGKTEAGHSSSVSLEGRAEAVECLELVASSGAAAPRSRSVCQQQSEA